jgi:hypothetical protein
MAESHVVSGLIAKRADMAGMIGHHKKEMERLMGALGHLDATIKLFAPEFDLRTVRAKEHRQRNRYFRSGECHRLVLEIFRDAPGPLSSRQIAEQIIERKQMEPSTTLIEQMQKNAIAVVHRLEKAKTIVLTGKDGLGLTWMLV